MTPDPLKFKVGETYRARFGWSWKTYKIHIMYVLDSCYEHEKLIVYRYYGKHKQWWHQDMKRDIQLTQAIEFAKEISNEA